MGKIIIKGKHKKIFFSAANYYGANLKIDVLNDNADDYIVRQVPMSEMLEPVEAFNTTCTNEAIKDVKVIALNDVVGLINSDRVSIDNEVYRITDINKGTKEVTLHRGLVSDITANTSVERVGNMGIYKIDLFVTEEEGSFIIQAKDTKYGLQLSDSITIKENTLEDLFDITNKEINQNERVILDTSGYSIVV